jgi:VWFA-related protein
MTANESRSVRSMPGAFRVAALLLACAAHPWAQTPLPAARAAAPMPQEKPTFRLQIDLVTSDIIVRDEKGNFVNDLKRDEFEIYEDGIKQDISSMTVVTGGRVTNALMPPAPPPPEGIILPAAAPRNDASGRILLFLVDDLHLQFHDTPSVRELMEQISKDLVHDGDMFGIVSSGPSAVAVDMTYDRKRLDEAIDRIAGSELSPTEIINNPSGSHGLAEMRYRAHVAFSTVNDVLAGLEKVHGRRKALVYVSDGYDFNPFEDARLGNMNPALPFAQNRVAQFQNQQAQGGQQTGWNASPKASDPINQNEQLHEEFADADLARELDDLTRSANRANVTMYTIDPRGVIGMGDVGDNLDPKQWQDYVRKAQDSLRVLADETGGIAIVNYNDFGKALKRIDAETGDYYVLGYYSKNPDTAKRRRSIEVKVVRPGQNYQVWSRKEYVLKPPPASTPERH